VIEPTRAQLSFAEGLIDEEVAPLWEEWMREVDELLADRALVQIVYGALARRCPNSRTRGRPGTPADVVLRLLLLKHMRNWSYQVLEREVRANLVYRQFTRVGAQKVPDAKTLGKLALALGPQIIEQIHARVVAIACEKRIVRGRRLRVDTTVVETDIHYPTDSSLLGLSSPANCPRQPQPCSSGPGASEGLLPHVAVSHGSGGRTGQALCPRSRNRS